MWVHSTVVQSKLMIRRSKIVRRRDGQPNGRGYDFVRVCCQFKVRRLYVRRSKLIDRWFTKTSIILFLNKIDLFRAKLPISPLSDTFPDYRGGANYDAACAFLLEKFVGLNKNPSKSIYAVSPPSIVSRGLISALYRCYRH